MCTGKEHYLKKCSSGSVATKKCNTKYVEEIFEKLKKCRTSPLKKLVRQRFN